MPPIGTLSRWCCGRMGKPPHFVGLPPFPGIPSAIAASSYAFVGNRPDDHLTHWVVTLARVVPRLIVSSTC